MKDYYYKSAWNTVPPLEVLEKFVKSLGLELNDTSWWKGEMLDSKIKEGINNFRWFLPYYKQSTYALRMRVFDSRLKLLQLLREALATHRYFIVCRSVSKKKIKVYSIIQMDENGCVKEEPHKYIPQTVDFTLRFE